MFVAMKLCSKYKVNLYKTYFRVSVNAANMNGTTADL